jgi:hypothetical protein
MFVGNLGEYSDENGFIKDYYPYDMTLAEFKAELAQMRENKYIDIGTTKM